MPPVPDGAKGDCSSCTELLEARQEVQALEEALRQERAFNEGLREQIAAVQQRLGTLEREAHRQAAPFRRPEKKRKDQKKKPGRKPGHAPAFRPPPPTVDQAVEVPLERCPHCQGPVQDVRAVEQIIEDIPEIRVRHVRLTTYRGHCPHCGSVASTHPDQVSTAVGAAGTQVGRHALALAADLNKHFGLPLRKTCAILREHFGLRLTPGGLSQALRRVARRLQVPFAQLGVALRASPAVHADETGWWLGGQSAWLWVFANELLTLYTIDNRSQEVIRRVLGDDFAGVLISDCLSSYDPHPGRKSKCCAHHLKAISEAFEQVLESEFLTDIRRLLKTAMLWHGLREEVPEAAYWTGVRRLQEQMTELLAQPLSQGPEMKVAKRLLKQREHLLTFLEVPGVAPTNNLAERQLRPAVIARKLSCGNKTESGKVTFEVLASLAATCRQQGRSFVELVSEAVSLGLPPPSLFAPG